MVTSRIVATGAGIPSQVITNDDLAQIMDTSDEWIRQRTGIGERHISGGEDLSYYTTKAARQIIERAGIAPEDIDLIVVATVTADYCTPSAACMVQKEIGAVNAVAFDVTAACSGFLYGVSVADKFIRCGVYKNALVIGGEILSKIVDWQDRSTCVLFGDGAAGVLLERSESQQGILLEELGAKGEDYAVLTARRLAPANAFNEIEPQAECGHVTMDGRAVFKFATKKIVSSIENVLEKSGVSKDEITYFITHQANARIVDIISRKLGISNEKCYRNMAEYGNTSSASIPIVLNELNEKGLIERGDKLLLTGFGGGMTWGTMLISW